MHKSSLKPQFARIAKNFSSKDFCEEFSNVLNIRKIVPSHDPNVALNNLVGALNETVNKHAPLEKLTQKQMKIKLKPWLTPGIIKIY